MLGAWKGMGWRRSSLMGVKRECECMESFSDDDGLSCFSFSVVVDECERRMSSMNVLDVRCFEL
jgi:hypothetical protein